jgi:hypothetical protein
MFTSEIQISQTATLRTVAVKDGITGSVSFYEYIIKPVIGANLAAGTYNQIKTVTLTASAPDSKIYYTLDGSAPTAESRQYSEPIQISETSTLKAFAITGRTVSDILSCSYTIKPDVSANLAAGEYTKEKTITLTASIPDSEIYYTLNGIDPKTNGIPYTTPFNLNVSKTLKIAAKNGSEWSGVVQYAYTFNLTDDATGTYTVNRIFFTNLLGAEITNPTESGFVVNVEVTRNFARNKNDYVIIAAYDSDGALINFTYLKPFMDTGKTNEMGALFFVPADKRLGKVKSFVWNGMSTMEPLSNTAEYLMP